MIATVESLAGDRTPREQRAESAQDGRAVLDGARQQHRGAIGAADAEEAARPALAEGEAVDAPVAGRFGDERAGDDRGADLALPGRQVRAEEG